MKATPFIPFVLGVIAAFILCHLPGKDLPQVPVLGIDKVVHFLMFFGLSILFFKASIKSKILLSPKYIIIWLIILVVYGVALELYQGHFVADRTADPFDAVANSLGAFAGIFVIKREKYIKIK